MRRNKVRGKLKVTLRLSFTSMSVTPKCVVGFCEKSPYSPGSIFFFSPGASSKAYKEDGAEVIRHNPELTVRLCVRCPRILDHLYKAQGNGTRPRRLSTPQIFCAGLTVFPEFPRNT